MSETIKPFSIDFIINNEEHTSPIPFGPRQIKLGLDLQAQNQSDSNFGSDAEVLNSASLPTDFSNSDQTVHPVHQLSLFSLPSQPLSPNAHSNQLNSPPLHESQSQSQSESCFKCPFENCNKSFSKKPNLKSHLVSHSGVRPYGCQQCGMPFMRKHDLKRHLISIHSISKPYKCIFCPASFSRMGSIKQHLLNATTTNHPIDAYQQYISFSKTSLFK
jgi:uncharacterized Zn-finger protein